MDHAQIQAHFFLEITKGDHKLLTIFYFIEISHQVLTELEFFCILGDVLLPTRLKQQLSDVTKKTHYYQTSNSDDLTKHQTRTNIFKYPFLPYLIMGWNKLSSTTLNLTYPMFPIHSLNIIWPMSNPIYNIQNYIDLKLLTI